MSFNDKKNRNYKSDFGGLGIAGGSSKTSSSKVNNSSSSKDQKSSSSSSRRVEEDRKTSTTSKSQRRGDENLTRVDEDEVRKSRGRNGGDVIEEKSSSRHRSRGAKEELTNGSDDARRKEKQHRSKRDEEAGDDEDRREKSHHRRKKNDHDDDNNDEDKREKRKEKEHHRSKRGDGEDENDKRHRRSSKHRGDDDDHNDDSGGERRHRDGKHRSERSSRKNRDDDEAVDDRDRYSKKKADPEEQENNYDEDFDDDFENDDDDDDDDDEKKRKEDKYGRKSSKSKNTSGQKYGSDDENHDDDDDNNYKSHHRQNHRRDDADKRGGKDKSDDRYRNRHKYDDYDDYNEEERGGRGGRVVRANAHVNVPTELVESYSSEIRFNHDSRDRQRRRAKDLLKTQQPLIELDFKSFSLLDINPVQMRTVYSSHLKHEKVQTNDDTLEIETQTDEIEMITRWTQHPADDIKGYGIEDQKFNYDASSDVLEQFRTEINVTSLNSFLKKSSKVVETLLRENESMGADGQQLLTENKSELEFSRGFSIFGIPKSLAKLAKTALLTNVVFAADNPHYLVCSYDLQIGQGNSTLLLVWNVDQPGVPYRVLVCETVSTCLCYFSFIVVSGNIDGSIVLWDLRELPSLHSRSMKKINEAMVVRSPTYTTAGVLLQENHMSEVKSMMMLQNQTKDDSKDVFMQLATLEIDCKLIIWTVVELKNIDSTVFETDLGLLPGGRVQLVKSYEIALNNIVKTHFGRSECQTWSMAVSSEKKNHFFVSTNMGQIIHIERKGKSFSSSVMKSNYTDLSNFRSSGKASSDASQGNDLSADGLLSVKTVSFHHEMSNVLLASYGDGEIRLYDVNMALPIKTWMYMLGTEIKEARWIESRSSCFIVLDEAGESSSTRMFVWDLLQDDSQPVQIKKIKNFGRISFPRVKPRDLADLNDSKDGGSKITVPFACFDQNSPDLQVHLFAKDWTPRSDKEAKKFAKLIKSYLLTF